MMIGSIHRITSSSVLSVGPIVIVIRNRYTTPGGRLLLSNCRANPRGFEDSQRARNFAVDVRDGVVRLAGRHCAHARVNDPLFLQGGLVKPGEFSESHTSSRGLPVGDDRELAVFRKQPREDVDGETHHVRVASPPRIENVDVPDVLIAKHAQRVVDACRPPVRGDPFRRVDGAVYEATGHAMPARAENGVSSHSSTSWASSYSHRAS
jgi:hypothetical protein